jgi:hypothetical protein
MAIGHNLRPVLAGLRILLRLILNAMSRASPPRTGIQIGLVTGDDTARAARPAPPPTRLQHI